MELYKEGLRLRREGDAVKFYETMRRAVKEDCVWAAFDLVLSEDMYKFPKAKSFLDSTDFLPYILWCDDDLEVAQDIYDTTTDNFTKGMACYTLAREEEAGHWFDKAYCEDGIFYGHVLVDTPLTKQVLFETRWNSFVDESTESPRDLIPEFIHCAKFGHTVSDEIIAAQVFGLKPTWEDYIDLKVVADVTLTQHQIGCSVSEFCPLQTRLDFTGDILEPESLQEHFIYGQFMYQQGIPECVLNSYSAPFVTRAMHIYMQTIKKARSAVLCWMWTNLLPYDLMHLIGKRYVWDKTWNDPIEWDVLWFEKK